MIGQVAGRFAYHVIDPHIGEHQDPAVVAKDHIVTLTSIQHVTRRATNDDVVMIA